tara:strand:- start:70 stop:285 length:216 start_codon:yes stop_codon:yes gene_type:complete
MRIHANGVEVKRKRGRPPKDTSGAKGGGFHFHNDTADAFREAKAQYEQELPYELTNSQFLMVLIHNLQQRQ